TLSLHDALPIFQRQCWMAAGEDQSEAVVGNSVRVLIRLFDGPAQPGGSVRFQLLLEPRAAADVIDGFIPGRLDDPSAWELRHPGCTPSVDGNCKGFLRRLFGEVEITHQPDERCDD